MVSRLQTILQRHERWMYRSGRPSWLANLLNSAWRFVGYTGLLGDRLITLEVCGRTSGRQRSLPLVVAHHQGGRFLVSMLGERASWVANVRAADGNVILHQGRSRTARLEEVAAPSARAPILRQYVQVAPAARAFIPVDPLAALDEYERIASRFPVFRIVPRNQ